jgi:DNA-binding MarR family transcriptional regulator
MDSTTLTRTLGLLQRRGWIERKPAKDKRQRILRLTKQGRARLEKARPLWRKAQEDLYALIGKDAFETLTRVSHDIVAVLHPDRSVASGFSRTSEGPPKGGPHV